MCCHTKNCARVLHWFFFPCRGLLIFVSLFFFFTPCPRIALMLSHCFLSPPWFFFYVYHKAHVSSLIQSVFSSSRWKKGKLVSWEWVCILGYSLHLGLYTSSLAAFPLLGERCKWDDTNALFLWVFFQIFPVSCTLLLLGSWWLKSKKKRKQKI